MVRLWALAFVVLAACGGSSKSPATPAAGPSCAAVADAMVGMMMEGKDASQIADTVEDFKTIIRTRCGEDAWTAEARQCLGGMQTAGDAERCSALMTEAQQANLVRDQQAKFGAGPNESPGATAPPPPASEPSGAVPPPTAPSPPPAEEPATQPAPKTKNKAAPKPAAKTGDPCDGGE